jgi:RNA polymerase sigma-70 factor (ECF subfamily)
MVNTSIDHIRKNKKNNNMLELDDTHGSIQVEEEEEDGNEILESVNFQDLLALVQELTPSYRSVFNLYVVDGYTHKEIADLLEISVGTSKSNLSKAKVNLRKLLNEKLERLAG